ncbi:MAG: MFS transporter [bacterium]
MHKKTIRMRGVVYLINFLFSFAGAVTLYTNSSYIENSIGPEKVGLLYALSAIVSILILTKAGPTLKRYGNKMYFFASGTCYALSLLVLSAPVNTILHVVALIVYLVTMNMLLFSLNIFFHHLEPKKGRGLARGFFLLLGNVGIMLGPFCAGKVIDLGGYAGTYVLGLAIFAVLAIATYIGLGEYKDTTYDFGKFESAFRHTLRTRTLRNVISANFILQFFYAWMVVYTPIYLSKYLGFSWDTIGIIFSVMLATFVILDYPLGKIADWLGSEKELSALGFLLMAGSVFSLALLNTPTALTVGALLFISRIGAATVEAMTEIHFFKVAKEDDPGVIALFADVRPLSYVLAPLLGALALAVLPFQMIFAVLGIILMIGFVVSFYLEKNETWWVPSHRD